MSQPRHMFAFCRCHRVSTEVGSLPSWQVIFTIGQRWAKARATADKGPQDEISTGGKLLCSGAVRHMFSCEIDPTTQAYIMKAHQPAALFRDIGEVSSCNWVWNLMTDKFAKPARVAAVYCGWVCHNARLN